MGPLKVPGGRFAIVTGGSLVTPKNREIGGALALGGRRFIKTCNYQMEVGFQGSSYIGDNAWPGRNVQGGIVFLFGMLKQVTKK